jgi:hypothetical protein
MNERGAASHEELQELRTLLVRALIRDLKNPKSVELLAVTRKLLRDNRESFPHDEAGQRQLQKLQRLYLAAVIRAFEAPEAPSAALLAEGRQLLVWAGVTPEIEHQGPAMAASQLLEQDLPFRHPP